MDILNLIKSIVNKTGTGAKDFATGYMSLSDKAEQMQKKGTMANLGHLTANALPPQSGVGGVDDIIRGIAPIGALMMGGLKETGVASKALNMLKPFTASTKGDPQFAADLLRDSAASIATKALKDPSSFMGSNIENYSIIDEIMKKVEVGKDIPEDIRKLVETLKISGYAMINPSRRMLR